MIGVVRRVALLVSGSVVLALAAALPAAAASLPDGRVGTPLAAPAGDSAAATVRYAWDRCRRYATVIAADDPAAWWPLQGGAGAGLRAVGSPAAAAGALAGEGGTGARLDGAADALV